MPATWGYGAAGSHATMATWGLATDIAGIGPATLVSPPIVAFNVLKPLVKFVSEKPAKSLISKKPYLEW